MLRNDTGYDCPRYLEVVAELRKAIKKQASILDRLPEGWSVLHSTLGDWIVEDKFGDTYSVGSTPEKAFKGAKL